MGRPLALLFVDTNSTVRGSMRKALHLVPFLTGVLGVTVAWAVASTGCSSNGSGSGPGADSGTTDATTDAEQDSPTETSTDSAVASDVALDTGTGPVGDSGTPESDSGTDSGMIVFGNDAGDAGAAALAFPGQLAAAICSQIAACCGTTGDAAAFNWQSCYSDTLSGGYRGSSAGAFYFPSGNVAFDPAQAQACLNAVAAVDCSTNQVTAAQEAALTQACFGVYYGILPQGSPCNATIECAPGNYCSPFDGGVGANCVPLAGDGGACGVLGSNTTVAQTVCSYLGAGANGLGCHTTAIDGGGNVQTPVSQWTCGPQWPVGASCWVNADCSSYICHEFSSTDYACANVGDWSNANTCAQYAIADAGGD